MSAARQLGRLLLAVVVVAAITGCSTGSAPTRAPVIPPPPGPTDPPLVIVPTPTANPCETAVGRVGVSAQRVGDAIVALRPLVVAKSFDSVRTLQAVRRISTLMAFDGDLVDVAGSCASTEPMTASIETFFSKADAAVTASLKAGFERKGQRRAAASLFKLLPSVVAISEANLAVASGLGLSTVALVVPEGAGAPLGKLPKFK